MIILLYDLFEVSCWISHWNGPHRLETATELILQQHGVFIRNFHDEGLQGFCWVRWWLSTISISEGCSLDRITSRVAMKLSRHSFVWRKVLGSVSLASAAPRALERRLLIASHRSSTSRSDLNPSVDSSTWVSTMKKPHISSVRAGSCDSGNGVGIIRSNWCWVYTWAHDDEHNIWTYLAVGLIGSLEFMKRIKTCVDVYTF
jgi:hypothetical protein